MALNELRYGDRELSFKTIKGNNLFTGTGDTANVLPRDEPA
jgi:hypothetical protein